MRRRGWLVAAGVAAVLVVTGGAVLLLSAGRDRDLPPPEDVVADYLATVRTGDAAAARAFLASASEDPGLAGAARDLLVDEAMRSDWEVTQVVPRGITERTSGTGDERVHHTVATVDVVLGAADGTSRQGRFQLVEADGRWLLRNPLVPLDLTHVPFAFGEFNGATTDADQAWLFPGAYDVYPSMSELMVTPLSTYVAVPTAGRLDAERFDPAVAFTETFHDRFHEQLAGWLEQCAATGQHRPPNCPFRLGGDLFLSSEWDTREPVEWTVDAPTVLVRPGPFGFLELHPTTAGVATARGEIPPDLRYAGSPDEFTVECPLAPGPLLAEIRGPDEFAFFVMGDPWMRCVRRQ